MARIVPEVIDHQSPLLNQIKALYHFLSSCFLSVFFFRMVSSFYVLPSYLILYFLLDHGPLLLHLHVHHLVELEVLVLSVGRPVAHSR